MKSITANMQNIKDNFLFSYFCLYFAKRDIVITIKAKASRNTNMKKYCGIVATHMSSIAVTAIINIISVLFIKSPT